MTVVRIRAYLHGPTNELNYPTPSPKLYVHTMWWWATGSWTGWGCRSCLSCRWCSCSSGYQSAWGISQWAPEKQRYSNWWISPAGIAQLNQCHGSQQESATATVKSQFVEMQLKYCVVYWRKQTKVDRHCKALIWQTGYNLMIYLALIIIIIKQ